MRAGALGYINKDNTTGRILDAIRSVRDGDIYLSEDAMRRLVHRTIGHSGNPGLSLESLSDRELEIFKLIGEGHSTERYGQSTSSERSHDRYLPAPNPAQAEHSERGGAHAHGNRMGPCRTEESELMMSATPQSLPVIESCDGCGACCLVVTRPPFYHVFEEMGEEAWDRLAAAAPRPGGRAQCRLPGPASQRRPLLRYGLCLV